MNIDITLHTTNILHRVRINLLADFYEKYWLNFA